MPVWKTLLKSFKGLFKAKKRRQRPPKRKAKKSSSKKILSRRKQKPPRRISRKSLSKKIASKKEKLPARAVKPPQEERVGQITHYFSRIGVVVLKMTAGSLTVGEKIHIKGRKTDFTQQVNSLQIESVDVQRVRKGQLVGLKVSQEAKEGDRVFK